jgi:two-component system NtrC family sensor kinase
MARKVQSHYSRIRKYILTSMILVPFIPFVLILGIGYFYFTTSLSNSSIASMRRIVEDHRQMIGSFLMERKSDLDLVLHSHSFEELSQTEKLSRVFNDLKRKSYAFADLGVFNDSGVHVAYHGPYRLAGKVYNEAPWFKEVLNRDYYISDVFLGYRKIPHFIIAIAREENGRKWVIRATIDTFMFNNLVRKVRIGKTGEAYILNKSGIFQTDRRSGGNLMDKDPDYAQYPQFHSDIKTFINADASGKNYLYATTWLKDKQWLLVVRQEQSDAFRALKTAVYLSVLVAVVGGVTIVGVAFYLTGRIVERIKQSDLEKVRLQEQLIRAGRLAELGEMAAGFAHEINNPLQIMKSEQALIEAILTDLMERGHLHHSEDLSELEESIRQIAFQIKRCSEITQAILKFGRKTKPELQELELQHSIPEIIDMVRKKADVHGITITQKVSEAAPPILADPSQLQQVLLNLFNNAIDAIIIQHGSAGGQLVVAAKPKENKNVEIRVKDNGCGVRPENLKKIFSPFFTTKPVGEGTGLGLSICYGIINSMGGSMEVESEQGVGTTFTIHLPAGA